MGNSKKDSRRKVLFILHLPPPVHGAAMVGKCIQDSTLINAAIQSDYINLSTSTSLAEIGQGGLRKIVGFFKLAYRVVNALVRTRYDICYVTLTATGGGFIKDFLILLILKVFRKKIVLHFHNKGVSRSSKQLINHLLYQIAFNRVKCILLSPSLYPDIERYVASQAVHYCPNGLPNIDISSVSAKPATSDSTPVRLLFLSNMMEEKGVFVLMEACKILKKNNVRFFCDFVGDWSNISLSNFEQKAKDLDICSVVQAHGKKFGSEKFVFLKSADIFVFPTFYHNEAFPLVLLEAMQFSLPVISTFEGGIPDLVVESETAFLVPQKDSVELAGRINLLVDNEALRRSMGKNGFSRFQQNFTVDKFEMNFLEIIRAVS